MLFFKIPAQLYICRFYCQFIINKIIGIPQIGKLDDLEDGQSYVCSGFGEPFKRLDYEASAQTPQSFRLSGPESFGDSASPSPARANNRLSRYLQVIYFQI